MARVKPIISNDHGGKKDLDHVLKKYMKSDVNFEADVMLKNTKLVQRVTEIINNAFKSDKGLQILRGVSYDGYTLSGSAVQNLKVRHPDEFDVMFVFKPDSAKPWHCQILDQDSSNAGYVNYDVYSVFDQTFDKMTPYTRIIRKKGVDLELICPFKFYQNIGKFIIKVLSETPFHYHPESLELELTDGVKNGPAVTITVRDTINGERISLDLVATLQIPFDDDFRLLVPKNEHWRWSCDQEQRFMAEIEGNDKFLFDVLKIIKTISCKETKTSPLCMFDSYFFKNVVFWMYHQKEFKSSLAKSFINYMEYLKRAIRDKKLPRFFEQNCNLLDRYSECELAYVVDYLSNLSLQSDYINFVNLNKKQRQVCTKTKLQIAIENFEIGLLDLNQIKYTPNFKLDLFGFEVNSVYEYGGKILLAFRLDGNTFFPVENRCQNGNFTSFGILHADDRAELVEGFYLEGTKFLDGRELLRKFYSIGNFIQNVIPAFVFKGNPEIDQSVIYTISDSGLFKIEVIPKLSRMIMEKNLFENSRVKIHRVFKYGVSKITGDQLGSEVYDTVLLNNYDDYRFSHEGMEEILLNVMLNYLIQSLNSGFMLSPVDKRRNVFQDYDKELLKDLGKSLIAIRYAGTYYTFISKKFIE